MRDSPASVTIASSRPCSSGKKRSSTAAADAPLCAILFYARQHDRAIETWRSVLERDPDFPRAHLIQAAYVEKGLLSAALADLEGQRSTHAPPSTGSGSHCSMSVPARQHRRATRLPSYFSTAAVVCHTGLVAGAFAAVGEKDSALAYLERA